jgi:hypothetical protein
MCPGMTHAPKSDCDPRPSEGAFAIDRFLGDSLCDNIYMSKS